MTSTGSHKHFNYVSQNCFTISRTLYQDVKEKKNTMPDKTRMQRTHSKVKKVSLYEKKIYEQEKELPPGQRPKRDVLCRFATGCRTMNK